VDALAAAIERWNVFAPTLPVSLSLDLLWIALPLALIGFLFLAVFSCGRRVLSLAVAAIAATTPSGPRVPERPRRRPGREPVPRAHRPRGPTPIGVGATA